MKNRDEVLDSALIQLNADPTSSMGDIAAAIGISRATLNRHFASRDALLRELGLRSLERWEHSLDGAAIEAAAASGEPEAIRGALERMVHAFVADLQDYGFTLTDHVITVMPDLAERCEALRDREIAFYRLAQGAGVLRRDLPPRWIENLMLGVLVAAREALRRGDVAPRDMPTLAVTALLHGISTNPNGSTAS